MELTQRPFERQEIENQRADDAIEARRSKWKRQRIGADVRGRRRLLRPLCELPKLLEADVQIDESLRSVLKDRARMMAVATAEVQDRM